MKESSTKTNSKASTSGKKRVKFVFTADPASKVYIAGTFNGWKPRQKKLKHKADGIHSIMLMLEKGRHEYKFIVDDAWCIDPACPEWIANDMGSLNSVITVN